MKKKWIVLLSVVLILFLIVGGAMAVMNGQVKRLDEAGYAAANPQLMPDGLYRGKADTLLVKVEAQVDIRDGKIEKVQLLKHFNGFGQAADAITDRMVDLNQVDVDTVSGAKASSIVIKAAVRDALSTGAP